MQLARTRLPRRRTAQPGNVGTGRLGGGVARQQAQHAGCVLQGRHQLVDAHQHHVHRRQGRHQPGIALVGHQRQAAVFGHRQVGAADAQIGGQKGLTQPASRHGHQMGDIVRLGLPRLGTEQLCHLVAEQVDGGHHHVTGTLPGQLHDPLAQVGFHRPHPGGFQSLVEGDLLAGHALALDRQTGAVPFGQGDDNIVGRPTVRGHVDMGAGRLGVADELVQVMLPFLAHFVLHDGDLVPQGLEIEPGKRLGARRQVIVPETVQRLPKARIGQGLIDAAAKSAGTSAHGASFSFPENRRTDRPAAGCAARADHARRWSAPARYPRCGSVR
jgi:hypothetical protein